MGKIGKIWPTYLKNARICKGMRNLRFHHPCIKGHLLLFIQDFSLGLAQFNRMECPDISLVLVVEYDNTIKMALVLKLA